MPSIWTIFGKWAFEKTDPTKCLTIAMLTPGAWLRYNRLQKIETMLTGGEWSESVSSPRAVSRGQSNVSKEF